MLQFLTAGTVREFLLGVSIVSACEYDWLSAVYSRVLSAAFIRIPALPLLLS